MIHEENSNIPFPEEEINAGDWHEVGKQLDEIESHFGPMITDYIQENTLNDAESVEELVSELE